ncbi:MAG: hypothetical protein Q4F15_06125 [Bacillota bacterium]|nr:hypothetical protein [Bacillota bacterium]
MKSKKLISLLLASLPLVLGSCFGGGESSSASSSSSSAAASSQVAASASSSSSSSNSSSSTAANSSSSSSSSAASSSSSAHSHNYVASETREHDESECWVVETCSCGETRISDRKSHDLSGQTYTYDNDYHWLAGACSYCGYEPTASKEAHSMGQWQVTLEATEDSEGSQSRYCSCGYSETESIAKLPHTHKYADTYLYDDDYHWHPTTCGHSNEDGSLSKEEHYFVTTTTAATFWSDGKTVQECECGKTIETTIAKGRKIGDTIELRSYPSSKSTNSNLATAASEVEYQDFGFYNEGSQKTGVYQYKDFTSGSDKYRAIYFSDYRYIEASKLYSGYLTSDNSRKIYAKHFDNGYDIRTTYYFKYEPISWTIVGEGETSSGVEYFTLLADDIIDATYYYHSMNFRENETIEPGDYYDSDIRAYLNGLLYETAFSSSEKTYIISDTVDNSLSTTAMDESSYYDCLMRDTTDSVFLPSYKDAVDYSISNSGDNNTDYAQALGLGPSPVSGGSTHTYSWTRSPIAVGSSYGMVNRIGNDGVSRLTYREASYTDCGIRPMIKIAKTYHNDSDGHIWSEEYEYDSEHHWHPATCCDEAITGKAEHTLTFTRDESITDTTNGCGYFSCDACGYRPSADLQHNLDSDGNCTACGLENSGYNGIKFAFDSSNNSWKVTGVDASLTSAVIPSTYHGHPVTSITSDALSGATALVSLTIPVEITSIARYAFSGSSLTEIIYGGTTEQWNKLTSDVSLPAVIVRCSDGSTIMNDKPYPEKSLL